MFILSFFLFFGTSVPLKISHLTALLQFKDPQRQIESQFTISAEGGCFNWASLNPNIVKVIPHYQSKNCSNSATVVAVATGPIRRSTAIIAESRAGTLKCDIFVDSVRKISILTTTRSIYNESSFETLSLIAMDSENNTFTSLEGADVKWDIDEEHLRKISTENAKLFLPKKASYKSSTLVIQGKKIGKTWAKATLNGIHSAYVDLNVVKAIAFLPYPIIKTLPFHHIPFKLCSARVGSTFNQNSKLNGVPIGITVDQNHISRVEFNSSYCISSIELPSNSYEITTSNPYTMTTNESGYATTYEPGESTMTATDISIRDNSASTLVYVMYPSREKSIMPPQWIALGDDPVFNPILKDDDGRPLDIFEPIDWVIQGEWKTVGTKRIKLIYHSFSLDAIVYVCPPLSMDPPEAILPLRYKNFKISPIGGSGQYEFIIDNKYLINYTDYRVTTFGREGRTKIYVQDKRIRKFHSFSDVIVSKVSHVDIQLERREILVDDYFKPKCDVYAFGDRRFSVEVESKMRSTAHDIVSNDMKSLQPGFSEIYCEAGYQTVKSDNILVSVAGELYAEVKGRGAPDSAIPLTISGGVRQWPGTQAATVTVSCPIANVTNFVDNKFFIDREYNGFCTAMMQNRKTELNPFPVKVFKDFWLNVSKVYQFDLYAIDKKASLNKRCNAPLTSLQYADVLNQRYKNYIRAYRIVAGHLHRLLVYPRDIHGNIINYYSGVPFTVQTSLGEQLKPIESKGRYVETAFFYTPMKSTEITITSPNLNPSTTSLIEIKPMELPSPQVVYYKKNKKYHFQVEDGSGYFTTKCQNASFNNGTLAYSPIKPSTVLIPINDSCTDHTVRHLNVTAVSVETLEIIAPPCVFVNTEFDAEVKAYGQRSIPLPDNLLHEASITLQPSWSKQVGENLWRLRPYNVGKLILTAVAENGVTKKATIEVIQSLIIKPYYIELLPGDSEYITVFSGPTNSDDIKFVEDDANIAKIVRHNNKRISVLGISPGNITINAYIDRHEMINEMEPFQIYVRVLRPLSLLVNSSAVSPIHTGYVGLRLLVLTDAGYRIPKRAEWNWTIEQLGEDLGYSFIQINQSFAFVNLSSQSVPFPRSNVNDVIVEIRAFNNLKTEYIAQVEPKLVITTPRTIILPPYCSYKIGIFNYINRDIIKECTFTSDNESIVTCDNGTIKSYSVEGQTTVYVNHRHQKQAIIVRVSNPAFLHIHVNYTSAKVMLLDPYGLLYHSVEGITYTLSGPKGITIEKTNYNGHYGVEFPSNESIELHASAFNSGFHLETSRNASIEQKITPSNALIVKGATLNFQCTALSPRWHASDTSVLHAASTGAATGLQKGYTRLYCNKIYSQVSVTEMTGIELFNEPNDLFRINKKYDPPIYYSNDGEDFVFKEPSDLKYICEFEDTSCANVELIQNQTEYYCKLNRIMNNNTNENNIYAKCKPGSKIKVSVSSESAHISFNASAPVSSEYHFGIASFQRYNITDAKRKIDIDEFIGKELDFDIIIPKYVYIEWHEYGFTLRVDETFHSVATITFIHKESGIKSIIELDYIQVSTDIPKRKFEISDDTKFIIALVLLFIGIAYIIFLLTESD